MKVILFLSTVVCAVGWLNQYVCTAAIMMYLADKKEIPPDNEIKEYLVFVWRKILRVN